MDYVLYTQLPVQTAENQDTVAKFCAASYTVKCSISYTVVGPGTL